MRKPIAFVALLMTALAGTAQSAPYTYTFSFDAASQNGFSLAADSILFESGQLLDGQPPDGFSALAAPGEDLNGYSIPVVNISFGSLSPAFEGGAVPVGILPAGSVVSFFFALSGSAFPAVPGTYTALNAYRVVSDGTGSGLFGNYVNVGSSSASLTIADVAPVPVPAAAWLLISGLGGLGAMARRRRAAA